MNEIPMLVAFSAGMLSFLSPCVLPMIPAYVSYLTGESISGMESEKTRRTVLFKSIGFVLGFSIIFIVLGASVSSLSQIIASNQKVFRKIGGLLVIVFGFHVSGLFKVKLFYREKRFLPENINTQGAGSVLLGMAFAAGWTPCVGPILSSILIYAGSMETVGKGILLLFFYSLGMGIPFILTALAIGSFTRYFKKYSKYLPAVSAVSGVLMIIFGILMFTDKLSYLSGYLSFIPSF